MYNPISTYRIQFHKNFTFNDFEQIIPYLQKLGISTVYASPVFEAVQGSTHGYDGLNPNTINPEIGTQEELIKISNQLKQQHIGWLQDIVPNHMAYHYKNQWLMDVLEKGPQSVYASYFDIPLSSPLFKDRLMVPFLGDTLEQVIKKSELTLAYVNQRFVLKYFDSLYPVNPRSYETILQTGKDIPLALQQLLQQRSDIKHVEDALVYSRQWDEFLLQLNGVFKNEIGKEYINKCLQQVNSNPKTLKQIADEQIYRLCHWQETDRQINYRRFFTVNGLICLNIQNDEVLQHYHSLIKKLNDEGVFQGLRIDHIDGLYDPVKYLHDLRKLVGDETYIITEKILEQGENLSSVWPLQGTTGYDFLGIVNNLFTLKQSQQKFTNFYQQLVGGRHNVKDQLYQKKEYILINHMGGELQNLYQLFLDLNLAEKKTFSRFHKQDLKSAIAEFLIQCPVYRYYANEMPLPHQEAERVREIFNRIRKVNYDLLPAIELLEAAFLKKPYAGYDDYNKKAIQFYQRCMQFTGPLMAKGVEDTFMYTYNNFIAHNEVGDSPESFGMNIAGFHDVMKKRHEKWPLSLNATSTHDTKRGEDVRARLNVLSDIADGWLEKIAEWQNLNKELKENNAPDANDEHFIYQSLVGAYPMPGEDNQNFTERFIEYIIKALREAKRHSNWTTPDKAYETAAINFASHLLDKSTPFWKSFNVFLKRIVDLGIINSLSQVLLKFTCPGIPDVYQGCEFWDLGFVDPDNRRAIDYRKRLQFLEAIKQKESSQNFLEELWEKRYNAQVKLWLVQSLYNVRQLQPEVFSQGQYIPLTVKGVYKENVLAFVRHYQQWWYISVIPLHLAQLGTNKNAFEIDWKDTRIELPKKGPKEWKHNFSNEEYKDEREIAISDILNHFPVALLKGQKQVSERKAGILLHISSLPSSFGIGDLGPEAIRFADFLSRTNQKYWQLLPLNPIEGGQGYSPYSSISSRAGNTLFISPELLVKDGLLAREDLHFLARESKVNYSEAERLKSELFDKAWHNYTEGNAFKLQTSFRDFCKREQEWLNDFAMYTLLKQQNGGKPWYEWQDEYKLRKPDALERIIEEYADSLEKIKFFQFLFLKQWKELKEYCNKKNISLVGDLPFYVSYDSVDIWVHKEIFSIDEKGNKIGMAGVPPDAFSNDGQLWGMPIFKWDILKQNGYKWWIERLHKNKELFDIVRLDHFRAFADYWEVPATESTAKNGEWKPGPGADFFKKAEEELGSLPFIAEDLGEINDEVFELRDAFKLPGMKVLQFAFDDNMPTSDYIPHNYTANFVAYTGTHDNNTSKGWYRQNASNETRNRVQQYAGRSLSEEDIPWTMARMVYSSAANIVILPMQDVLGLDETARMNTPAGNNENWSWRLLPDQLNTDAEDRLKEWVWLYNRS
jgi:malto-oligosyltrehalose synthase/4-alpha-glucanotransferase